MKRLLVICSLALTLGWSARGGIIYSTFANGGTIPDDNPVGTAGTATVSGLAPVISAITVTLDISGGYNGDLYAYLSYDGILIPLLNRVGVGTGNAFGYGDSGFDITLSSSAANNIHFYQNDSPSYNSSGQLTGTWQPDGRAIDPQSSPGAFDSAGTVTFAALNGLNPNGTWTLFIADLSAGAAEPLNQLESQYHAVPEPVNVALLCFGALAALLKLLAWRRAATRTSPAS